MAGPDGLQFQVDSITVASQFASNVKDIYNRQKGIAAQGAQITEKVQDVQNVKKVENVKGDKKAQDDKNVPGT